MRNSRGRAVGLSKSGLNSSIVSFLRLPRKLRGGRKAPVIAKATEDLQKVKEKVLQAKARHDDLLVATAIRN